VIQPSADVEFSDSVKLASSVAYVLERQTSEYIQKGGTQIDEVSPAIAEATNSCSGFADDNVRVSPFNTKIAEKCSLGNS